MKTEDNRCRECGTKLHGKNAIDVGYCLSCYNMMMADPEDDEDDFKPKQELTQEDRARIEQAAISYTGGYYTERHDSYIVFVKGAEYATIYEREKQAKELGEAPENVNYGSPEHLRYVIRKLKAEKEKLEAERTELRNKVAELEEYIKKIQDKAIELYGNQIELP